VTVRHDPFAGERPGRLAAVRGLLAPHELDAIVVQNRTTSRYLSGFTIRRGDESTSGYSGTLVVTQDRGWLLVDNRYLEQAGAEAPGWDVVLTTEPLPVDLPRLLARADGGTRRIGLEADRTTHAAWRALDDATGTTELVPIEAELAELRITKSPREVAAIGRACALGDEAFAYLCAAVEPGMTERQVARLIAAWFEDHGAEDSAFDAIVLVGARGSMPHGTPDDTPVAEGQALLLDFGCQVDGYRSDMTRTVFVGEPGARAREQHAAVVAAQRAAFEAVAVDVPASVPHLAARAALAEAGYPEAFLHGVGHGIGLDTHEPPALKATSETPLRAGMVFSVEPGLYLPGEIGIRVEDIVVLEADGPRFLTGAPRDALVIGPAARVAA
jgi:Xaa-Pro aminopeptidase